jgi:hypothetical protein
MANGEADTPNLDYGRTDLTSAQALATHSEARETDPDHDQVGCWCCCWDCGLNYDAAIANDEAQGLTSVFS